MMRSGNRQVQSLYGEENEAVERSNALKTIRSKLSDHEKLEKEFQVGLVFKVYYVLFLAYLSACQFVIYLQVLQL